MVEGDRHGAPVIAGCLYSPHCNRTDAPSTSLRILRGLVGALSARVLMGAQAKGADAPARRLRGQNQATRAPPRSVWAFLWTTRVTLSFIICNCLADLVGSGMR